MAAGGNHSDSLMAYFNNSPWHKDPSKRQRRRRQQQRRFSFDNSDHSGSWRPPSLSTEFHHDNHADDDEDSKVGHLDLQYYYDNDESDIFDRSSPNESKSARDDSYLNDLFGKGRVQPTQPTRTKQQQQPAYRYQICLFIQMQLCNPSTLADWIRARNRNMELDTATTTATASTFTESWMQPALQIFEQICSGLAHVHEKGIVHRDLKPANIFASKDGSTFLIGDFGLSKLLQRKSWGDPSTYNGQTRQDRLLLMYHQPSEDTDNAEDDCIDSPTNEPSWTDPLTAGVGTASYASPEQVASRSYGKEADIFSLGLILLELLCCFSTEHERLQTFHDCRYRRDLPAGIQEIPALADIILQCTDKCPTNRPTAAHLQTVVKRLASPSNGDADSTEGREQYLSQIDKLKLELSERNQEVAELKAALTDKDKIIEDMQLQLSLLRKATIQNKTVAFAEQPAVYGNAENFVARERSDSNSSSSSSSDNQI
jgi:serine/threonine protein kinase